MPISFGDTAINDYEIVRLLLSVGDPEESHEALHFERLDPSLLFHEQGPCLTTVQHDWHNERLVEPEFGVSNFA